MLFITSSFLCCAVWMSVTIVILLVITGGASATCSGAIRACGSVFASLKIDPATIAATMAQSPEKFCANKTANDKMIRCLSDAVYSAQCNGQQAIDQLRHGINWDGLTEMTGYFCNHITEMKRLLQCTAKTSNLQPVGQCVQGRLKAINDDMGGAQQAMKNQTTAVQYMCRSGYTTLHCLSVTDCLAGDIAVLKDVYGRILPSTCSKYANSATSLHTSSITALLIVFFRLLL